MGNTTQDEKLKQDLQKQATDLQKQKANLEKRRDELSLELTQTEAEIKTHTQLMGAAMLEGKDYSKASEAITSAKRKFEGLSEAFSLSNINLKALESAIENKNHELTQIERDRIKGEAESLAVHCIINLLDTQAGLEALDEKFREYQPLGLDVSYVSEVVDVKNLRSYLAGNNLHTEGIKSKLKHISENYTDLMLRAINTR